MIFRRKFLKTTSLSLLTFFLFPYKFLYSATKKIINKNLSKEQKNIMFNEGTERPFTSELLKENREGFYHCANCGCLLYTSPSPRDVEESRMPSSA